MRERESGESAPGDTETEERERESEHVTAYLLLAGVVPPRSNNDAILVDEVHPICTVCRRPNVSMRVSYVSMRELSMRVRYVSMRELTHRRRAAKKLGCVSELDDVLELARALRVERVHCLPGQEEAHHPVWRLHFKLLLVHVAKNFSDDRHLEKSWMNTDIALHNLSYLTLENANHFTYSDI